VLKVDAPEQAAQVVLTLTGGLGDTVGHLLELFTVWSAALALADLRRLQVETTDLSELDVVKVELGQPVMVTFKALA
jgi:hypothetical protein